MCESLSSGASGMGYFIALSNLATAIDGDWLPREIRLAPKRLLEKGSVTSTGDDDWMEKHVLGGDLYVRGCRDCVNLSVRCGHWSEGDLRICEGQRDMSFNDHFGLRSSIMHEGMLTTSVRSG